MSAIVWFFTKAEAELDYSHPIIFIKSVDLQWWVVTDLNIYTVYYTAYETTVSAAALKAGDVTDVYSSINY